MIWLWLTGAVACCYLAWVSRHIGGPFRPIRSELSVILQDALLALAMVCAIGAAVGPSAV